jgi:hypothetical protein
MSFAIPVCSRTIDSPNIGDESSHHSLQLLNNGPLLDTTPPVMTVSTMPNILWPPNGTMRPVTISGTISDTGSGVDPTSAAYSVRDEYGDVQPKGAIIRKAM